MGRGGSEERRLLKCMSEFVLAGATARCKRLPMAYSRDEGVVMVVVEVG